MFSAKGSRVFEGRTVAIAAELEDVGNELYLACDPLRWHMVRSSDAKATGLYEVTASPMLKDYVDRKMDASLVTTLVEMHGSSIDFDADNGTAASTGQGATPATAPTTRGSALFTPTKYEREAEEEERLQAEEANEVKLQEANATIAKLKTDYSKISAKNRKLETEMKAKPAITNNSKISLRDLEIIEKAAEKGAKAGSKPHPITTIPPSRLAAPAQDNGFMLQLVDRFRDDSKYAQDNLVKLGLAGRSNKRSRSDSSSSDSSDTFSSSDSSSDESVEESKGSENSKNSKKSKKSKKNKKGKKSKKSKKSKKRKK
jgi:hypothetical protein